MRRKLVLVMALMIVVLLCMLGVMFKVQGVEASATIHIRADGSVDPATASISSVDNIIYTFTDNISGHILVERDNIVIDGEGYTLRVASGCPVAYRNGVLLSGRRKVTIDNMRIEIAWYGIRVENCSGITISGVTIIESLHGILLSNCSNNKIIGNSVISNYHNGIHLRCSSDNTIQGNRITDNGEEGIMLDLSSNNGITENVIERDLDGIVLIESSCNRIIRNNITANTDTGMWLYSSSENLVHHNNFIENLVQIYTFKSCNVWDDGFEGNYWSNYAGVDLVHDGIGNSLHFIDANNTDNYPLMGMFFIFNTSVGNCVNVISNSTIEDLQYFKSNSTIKMHVSGEEGFVFCRVSIPHVLMNVNNVSVIIDDGLTPVLHSNYTLHDNGTHRWIYFAYEHSIHEIDIVPEFPSFLILPLFMIATLLAVIVYRKKHNSQWNTDGSTVSG